MYQAIVFLPLLGAILAGLIALGGARARCGGEGPPRRRRGRCDRPRPASRRAVGRGRTAPSFTPAHHEADDHGPADEPAAAGSRTAELITTTLLMISMILSWIAFVQVGFGHHDDAGADLHLDGVGRSQDRLVAAHRHAHRGDAGRGQYGIGVRAPLFDRLHGGGPVPAALLRLSVDVHLRHADAGDGRQSGAAVLRLGRRRARELSADRLLVSQAGSERGGDQGFRRQPDRRFRLRARHFRDFHADRQRRIRRRVRRRAGADRQDVRRCSAGSSTR